MKGVPAKDDSSFMTPHVAVVQVTKGCIILVIADGKRVPNTKVVSVVLKKKRDWSAETEVGRMTLLTSPVRAVKESKP